MKKQKLIFIAAAMIMLTIAAWRTGLTQEKFFLPDNPNIQYQGRIDFSNPAKPRLSGAGSYLLVKFRGTTADILLTDQNLYQNHNYLAIEIDGFYQGRTKISAEQAKYRIASDLQNTDHTLLICKATEAQIGYIEFLGIYCDALLPAKTAYSRKIEFIGNSITCGMGVETSEIPCDRGAWYDQHNAYLAYGPQVARKLRADWLLSSVSGIGIARNWNSAGPTMPEVYQNLYLNSDSTVEWQATRYIPDLVSICLGTNDFSAGDGSSERAALDSAVFVNRYLRLVKIIRQRYPSAQICCLTSPAISTENGIQLRKYLTAIIQHLQNMEQEKKISLFVFSRNYSSGCTGHPDQAEQESMAAELLPFYKRVMDW